MPAGSVSSPVSADGKLRRRYPVTRYIAQTLGQTSVDSRTRRVFVAEGQWLVASLSGGRAALFYSLVLLHAVAALVGFGSIGFAGTYASRAYLPSDATLPLDEATPGAYEPGAAGTKSTEVAEQDAETEELLRYFQRPARLWLAVVAVPFLGLGALAANPDLGGLDQAWVLGALLVWLSATLIAGSLVVPALRQMRSMLFPADELAEAPAGPAVGREAEQIRFARTATLAGRGAACCDVLFFVALALMIWRP
jgi:hypothetical protein